MTVRWGEMVQNVHWRLTRSVAPVIEPVSPSDFGQHVRFDSNDEDSLIVTYLASAREEFESDTLRALLTQTWVLRMDCFPDDVIELRRCPVQSVTSITYLDSAGASQTLATSVYTVDIYSEPARITFKYGQSWPTTYSQANAVTVTFVAGYGDTPDAVPEMAKQAIRLKAASYFENRTSGDLAADYEAAYQATLQRSGWAGYR